MAGGAIRAGKAYIELFIDQTKADKDVATWKAKLAKNIQSIGSTIGTVRSVVDPIVQDIAGAVNQFVDHGGALDAMAHSTGVAASALSELQYAADQNGVSMEDLEKALIKMNRTVGEARQGSKQAQDALAALGLSVEDLAGMTPDQMLEVFGDRLASVPDAADKAARGMDIFGRSADTLNKFLKDGAGGIQALRQQARDLKLGWSEKDVQVAADLGDRMATFKMLLQRVQELIGAKLGPMLIDTFDRLNWLLVRVAENMDTITAAFEKLWWLNKQLGGWPAIEALWKLIPADQAPVIPRPPRAFDPIEAAAASAKATKDIGSVGSFNPFELSAQAWSNPIVRKLDQLQQAVVDAIAQLQLPGAGVPDFGWAP